MNALDKLKYKALKQAEELTLLERLILQSGLSADQQLQAAAELHDLNERAAGKQRPFSNMKDVSEIASHHV